MRRGFPTREDQIIRRRERAEKGAFRIRNAGADPVFSIFEVASESGRVYRVQIRSLTSRENTCTCPDYQVNLLGTCKHIEAVSLKIKSRIGKRALAAARPTCAQVYLGFGEEVAVRVSRPQGFGGAALNLIARHFDDSGLFRGDPVLDLPAFLDGAGRLPPPARSTIQVADEVVSHAGLLKEALEDRRLLDWYLKRVRRGDRTFDLLSKPLYPFQVKGLLHIAFNRRSLLADDMGLGKTVQALAASLLLREIKGIERVLVVCPASLKHQWAREIARFTSLPVKVIEGPYAKRRLLYDEPAFFTAVNYELVLRDRAVFERFRPDLVILDEAQRIRNWKTKTADAVKAIPSRYAFVLTGTPLENRLDDLYSIFQFIDPRILGPLWRFNERYFVLERTKSGAVKILGHQNLDELRARIAPKVLRRRKEEVLSDLPDRVDNNYFVEMTPEQWEPYNDFKSIVARLVAKAGKKPLTPREEKQLLMALVKMRILCNALELHDPNIDLETRERTCPKARELEKILREQVLEAGRKALVFSQWEGMIDIARRVLENMGIGWVKLCGSVPSSKRGALIDRFRTDPAVRVFLSTDAGSVGLNLQAANLVVNLDVPWNPAVLDQRVGRAHRIGQREVVNVVNLVARSTIEERVLDALDTKREVFKGVFGMEGEAPDSVSFGERGTLVRRLKEVLQIEGAGIPSPSGAESPTGPPRERRGVRREEEPFEALADALIPRFKGRILLLGPAPRAFGGGKVLVVVDENADALRPAIEDAAREVAGRFDLPGPPECAVFDRGGYASLLALLGGREGNFHDRPETYRAPSFTEGMTPGSGPEAERRLAASKARSLLERGRRRYLFARHALDGGFAVEAMPPLREALVAALSACFVMEGKDPEGAGDPARIEEVLVRTGIVPEALSGSLYMGLSFGAGKAEPSLSAACKVAQAADEILTLADERAVKALA